MPRRDDPLAPPDVPDAVVDAYKAGVDRTLLRERLRQTPSERAETYLGFLRSFDEFRSAVVRRGTPA